MTFDENSSLAAIVLEHSAHAKVFERHGLDYCCKGTRSLGEAARAVGLEPNALLTELEHARATPHDEVIDPRQRSTASLVAYIVGRYHDPLRAALPTVRGLAEKAARVHGAREPHFRELFAQICRLSEELLTHLDMEERRLFPSLTGDSATAHERSQLLHEMERDHLDVAGQLESLRSLTHGYCPSEGACATVHALFEALAELESELLRHVHLENHVLLPRFSSG